MSLLGKFPFTSLSRFALAAVAVILINHVMGLIGLNVVAYKHLFENLSAVNLLLSFILVIVFQKPLNGNFILFCAAAFAVGMAAEICGVNTGQPFGIYDYTSALGPQLFSVPLIIGLNWILLSYVCTVVVKEYIPGKWPKMVAAALLMVTIDLLLEGFAIRHHLWVWQNALPPVQNFVAWFFVALLIQLAAGKWIPKAHNILAGPYLLILFLFLIADWIVALLL